MTSLFVETTYTLQPEKRNWLLGPHGTEPGATPTVTVDISAFTAATHYPNGYIPSGTVVGTITASSTGGVWMVGPYDNAAADGRQTAVGFLFNSVKVPNPADTTKDVADAILVHGFVDPNKLPFSGATTGAIDAAGRVDLPMIHFAPVTP
jgi:hypothetical protein